MDQRLKRFQATLNDVNGALIESPVDLLYLTGLHLSRGRLWVADEPCLFVDGRYLEVAKKSLPYSVRSIDEKVTLPKKVVFDSAFTSYDAFSQLKKKWPDTEWIAISSPLKYLRAIKEPSEMIALQRASRLTLSGIEHVKHLIAEGVTEKEIAFQFEFFCRKQGASGFSFDSIVAFAEASAYPHYRAGNQKLQKNQLVLIDVGAIVDGYRGDLTRTLFFGTPHPELLRFQKLVKEAFDAAFDLVRPGVVFAELDKAARKVFQAAGVEKLFVHSLGHGIGLEAHEYPTIRSDTKDVIQAGMVFTIEPGLYQPGLGGIRFEETILVTETGAKILYA